MMQVYAPTSVSSEEEVDEFNAAVHDTIDSRVDMKYVILSV